MVEKLENLEAEGKVKVETYDQKMERIRAEQARETQMRQMKEQMNQRKAALKQSIELMELEVRFKSLQNQFTEEGIRAHKLNKEIEELGLNKPEEQNDNNTDPNIQ